MGNPRRKVHKRKLNVELWKNRIETQVNNSRCKQVVFKEIENKQCDGNDDALCDGIYSAWHYYLFQVSVIYSAFIGITTSSKAD